MRIIATITIDATKETMLEGDSPFMSGGSGDQLEQKGLGFWLDNYRFVESEGKRYRKGRVFCPWTSVLYVQTKENGGERCR